MKLFRKKKKEAPLNEINFFLANDPIYLEMNPEIKKRLIEHEKINKPDECLTCIFLAYKDVNDRRLFFCPFNDISLEFGKRADGCVLDT